MTDAQLKHWTGRPSFYDRNVNWVGPLESGATSSLAQTFNIYRSVEGQSNFLEIEHSGVRYANLAAKPGVAYRSSVLYEIAKAGRSNGSDAGLSAQSENRQDTEMLALENWRQNEILRSRGRLFGHLLATIVKKMAP